MTLRQTVTELFDHLPARPVLRTFMQYFIAFCSRPESANDVIAGVFVGLIVPDNAAILALTVLENFEPIALGDGIFDRFFVATFQQKQQMMSYPVGL